MKELMQKVIEAGLVPKHTLQLLEKWKLVELGGIAHPPTAAELERRTQEELLGFAQDIASLLEERTMPEMHETDLLLEHLFQQHAKEVIVEAEANAQRLRIDGVLAVQTRDGRIVLRRAGAEKFIEVMARPGNIITYESKQYEIKNVEVRYQRETPEFYSCEVREIHAEV